MSRRGCRVSPTIVFMMVFALFQLGFLSISFGKRSKTSGGGEEKPGAAEVPVATPCPVCPTPAPLAALTLAPTVPAGHPTSSPYKFYVNVFTYNRMEGLPRLMESLLNADYLGRHDITLRVFLDFPKDKLKPPYPHGVEETRQYLDQFHWPHGDYLLHRRLVNVGLKRTIMESWYPTGNHEFAAFFEDDIEVSPQWFTWAARGIETYLYRADGERILEPGFLGLSLFRPIMDELSQREAEVDNQHEPFLLQQPCSWGAVYTPELWRAFRQWYDLDPAVRGSAQLVDPSNPRIRPSSNTWDSGSSWKKFLIRLMYERGWYMLYPNPPDRLVLSTNHLLPGEHPTPSKKLFELPLVPSRSAASEAVQRSIERFPALKEMRAFDVMFDDVGTLDRLPNYERRG